MNHKKPFGKNPGPSGLNIPDNEGLKIPNSEGLNIPWNPISGNEGFPIPGSGTFYIPRSEDPFGGADYSSLDDLDNIPDPPGRDDQTPIPDA